MTQPLQDDMPAGRRGDRPAAADTASGAAPPADATAPALGHSGIVAIVGRANVGKSTLMNALLGEKVSIVSASPQTTRNVIRGILTDPRGQLVLLDTPGVHRAHHDLSRLMNQAARLSVEGADAVLLVLDRSTPPREEDEGWMTRLARSEAGQVFALNKADLEPNREDAYREAWRRAASGQPQGAEPLWHAVSGLKGRGVDALTDTLFALLPPGPPLFPQDMLTDFPKKWTIGDVIREKLFARLRDDLPHAVAVIADRITDTAADCSVDVQVLVAKPSQKGIVLGTKGRLLRVVKEEAEAELAALYGKPVRLFLWVKVQPDWPRNHWILRQLGYT